MAAKPTGAVTGLTRGGQIFHHYIKMLWEVTAKLFSFVLGLCFIVFCFSLYLMANKAELFAYINHVQAWWVIDISDAANGNVWYVSDWTDVTLISAMKTFNHPTIIAYADNFKSDIYWSGTIAAVSFIVIYIGAFFFLKWKGKDLNEEHHVRGSKLVDDDSARDIILKNRKNLAVGNLKIGDIPLLSAWEPQSFLCIGGPGSGKSVLTADWIEQARKENRKALILDRSGGFIEKFYDPTKDIIINPYDKRTAKWSIFKECRADYHYNFVTNTLIQKTDKDVPFWPLAARLVFKSLLMKEAARETPCIENLMKKIMTCSLDQMVDYCKGTDAASVFDGEGMKMAQSIRSVIASEVEILRVLDGKGADFSVREWVENDGDGFIFISTLKDQEEALRPFITLLCDIYMNAVLSLKPDLSRRIWSFLDELQALGKVTSLAPFLAESRKYGGCCFAGFQGYSQAKRIYGDEGVEELSDLFGTFIVMRCNGNKSAEWAGKQLGKTDNIEVNESLSYGINSARDGANLQNNRRERDVVLASELQNLEDLEGYVRFGRRMPVSSFELQWKARKDKAVAFDLDEELINRQMNLLKNGPKDEDDSDYFGSVNGDVESSLMDARQSMERDHVPPEMDVPEEELDAFLQQDLAIDENNDQVQLVDTFSDLEIGR